MPSKKAALVVTSVGIGALITMVLLDGAVTGSFFGRDVLESPGTDDHYTLSSVPDGPGSYLIWVESSTYYSKNVSSGVVSSSTDASQIFNWCMGNLTSGEVEVAMGEYIITTPITVKSRVKLSGEGFCSKLKLADNADCPILTSSNTQTLIHFVLADIHVNGNRENQGSSNALVHLYNPRRCTIRNSLIKNSYGTGIWLEGDVGEQGFGYYNKIYANDISFNNENGIYITGCDENHIFDNTFDANKQRGIYTCGGTDRIHDNILTNNGESALTEGAITVTSHNNVIRGNHIDSAKGIGIKVYFTGVNKKYGNIISENTLGTCGRGGIWIANNRDFDCGGNTVESPNRDNISAVAGIRLEDCLRGKVHHNRIYCRANPPNMTYGIYVPSSATDTEDMEITYNTIVNWATASIQLDAGSNYTVIGNEGFTTENSGIATISSSASVTFDHGLAGMPTFVLASFNATGWGSWKWSATSTQITITVETSGTYRVNWYAEYQPLTELKDGVKIDETPPSMPSPDDGVEGWSNDDTPTFSWLPSIDSGSGVKGYHFKVDDGSESFTTETSVTLLPQSDELHTFYVRAEDNAGLLSDWGSHDFSVDTAPPPAPTISSSSHPDEDAWYPDDDPVFEWTTPPDPSGIAGYSCVLDDSPSTIPDETIDTTGDSESHIDVADGEWWFHVRAEDNAGNWGSTDHYKMEIKGDTFHFVLPEAFSAVASSVISIVVTAMTMQSTLTFLFLSLFQQVWA